MDSYGLGCSAFRCASRERELRSSCSLSYSRLTHALAVLHDLAHCVGTTSEDGGHGDAAGHATGIVMSVPVTRAGKAHHIIVKRASACVRNRMPFLFHI